MKITVPATSANIGPGFDSVGVALSKYLTIEILEPSDQWHIDHQLGDIPTDETNLLLKTALTITPTLPPHRIRMSSDIPLARGLGSSSSVIVAGIELANQLGHLELSDDEKFNLATEIEGHPDNVGPALFGNLVIANYNQKRLNYVVANFPDCAFIAFIPSYELKTSASRGVLPTELAFGEAVAASAVANVAIASLLTGDLEKAGQAIMQDKFHEHYRQHLVAEFQPIKDLAMKHGAYATYLSGAGPTVMTLAPQRVVNQIVTAIQERHLSGEIAVLSVDKDGVRCEK